LLLASDWCCGFDDGCRRSCLGQAQALRMGCDSRQASQRENQNSVIHGV
jgi:hypothetical protein